MAVGGSNVGGATLPELNAVREIAQSTKDAVDAGGVGGGNVLKITFADGFIGQEYTVAGGDETFTGTVPATKVVNVTVKNCNTEYTISAEADTGDEYSTTVTTGAYYGQYTAALNTFEASLEVTTKAGAVVTVAKGAKTQTATADTNGKANFTLNGAGAYSIKAEYEDVESETATVNATTQGESYTATVNFITLTITAEAGSAVTLGRGSFVKTYTSVGAATFYLPELGEYTATATKNGQTATETVNATAYTAYTMALNYFVYCGIQVDESNTNTGTAVTYIGDAVGMSTGYNAWKGNGIFKNIKPCVVKDGAVQYYLDPDDFSKKADGTAATINSESAGDVMIQIPKLGYKMAVSGTTHTIYVTDDPAAEGYCYRAHSLDAEGDCDFLYVGAYLACNKSNKLYSLSGQTPAANITLTNARSYAAARGTGFQLLSFYPLTLLQCLYLLMYKDRDGQTAIGKGWVNQSAATATGATNTKGMCWGETTGKQQMKFLGLEDFWGNLRQWVDGLYSDGSRNVKTAFKSFADDGSSYPYSKASGASSNLSGWLSGIQGTNEGGFIAKAVSGSATTHWADGAYLNASGCAYFGGYYSNGDYAGPFCVYVSYAASSSGAALGARLIYKHKKAA